MAETNIKAMKAQQTREARQRLSEEFAGLLEISPDEGAVWEGSMSDLMEITHIAYLSGMIADSRGRMCTFDTLASRVCLCMNRRKPTNPRGCAHRAEQRKGVRETMFIERYRRMVFDMEVSKPLETMVRRAGLWRSK